MDNDGDSFDDCVAKCTRSNGDDDETDKKRTRTSSRAVVSETDCHCYCSMVHDPCNEDPTTVTGML